MAFAAATHSRDLTDEQWDLIGALCLNRCAAQTVEGALEGEPWVLNGILWILVERFAWFQNFRWIVRYERLAENVLGMLQLASCLILLRVYEMASN
jgi:hypothetical protein